ncbi:MAG: hypothetical protein R2719_05380 [Micropruina sp.]
MDVSPRVLERAERRLGLDRLSERQREKLSLWQSSATYRDDRLAGFDAILLVEVIEHRDPDRIGALEGRRVRRRPSGARGADHPEPGLQRDLRTTRRRLATPTIASNGPATSSPPG